MFNKREAQAAEDSAASDISPRTAKDSSPASGRAARGSGAVIGASIHIDGSLKGDEDLLIQGRVKGMVELKNNSVTIGESGQVNADIFAHTIVVEGQLEGKLVASERVVIRQTARIKGTIVAPRVKLEDGAQFNGSIDMDPETEALKSAFAAGSTTSSPAVTAPGNTASGAASSPGSDDQQAAKSLL